MTNVIGYVRRSSDRQEESLEQQRAKLEAYAQSKGWQLKAIYSDDAISGSEMHRPGLDQLMQTATDDDDVQIILAWDRNRIARPKDAVDGMMLERRIMKAGKRVVYAATGRETDQSFESGLMGYIEHHQNGDYLRKLSRDTMRGIVSRVQRGLWPGGPIPFGYDRLLLDGKTPKRIVRDMEDGSQVILNPESGKVIEELPKGRKFKKQDHETCTLVPSDPARVRALQKLFCDFAAGKPSRTCREELNSSGFRTSRGNYFTPQTLLPILENRAYLGQLVYNKRTESKWHRYVNGQSVERLDEGLEKRSEGDLIITDDAWEPLIDQATFDKVQERRQESKAKNTHYRGNAMRSQYLLSGLFYCGVCGGKMTGSTTKSGKGYKKRYYVCSCHSSGQKDRCPKRYSVPAQVVEDHVTTLIRSDLEKLKGDKKLADLVQQELEKLFGRNTDAQDQLQRRVAELDQKLANLRQHLIELDAETAKALGIYDQANDVEVRKRMGPSMRK